MYRGTDEKTLELLLFPQEWSDDPAEREVKRRELSEIDSQGGMDRFWENVEILARDLGEWFEQDKVIVAAVRNGVADTTFYTWGPA